MRSYQRGNFDGTVPQQFARHKQRYFPYGRADNGGRTGSKLYELNVFAWRMGRPGISHPRRRPRQSPPANDLRRCRHRHRLSLLPQLLVVIAYAGHRRRRSRPPPTPPAAAAGCSCCRRRRRPTTYAAAAAAVCRRGRRHGRRPVRKWPTANPQFGLLAVTQKLRPCEQITIKDFRGTGL
jgi:hypothetical protein